MNGKVFLKSKEDKRLAAGHLWVFSNEIQKTEGNPPKGGVVEVLSSDKRFIGQGFYNPNSLIAVRLLAKTSEPIDKEFFKKKIEAAYTRRKELYPSQNSCRVIFGESDGMPGLICDKYEDYLVLQVISYGFENVTGEIISALKEIFNPKGIALRNDSSLRLMEGLEEKKEAVYGDIPEYVTINENGFLFNVNMLSGQKTGFFLDQRDNRLSFSKYCGGKTVLDLYCHTGAFGVYAAGSGASRVVCVDSSKPALAAAKENAKLNKVEDKMLFVEADVEEYMETIKKQKAGFDVISIDPPALMKNKKNFYAALRLYVSLNETAIGLLNKGGVLASSSCSHHLNPVDFREMLKTAAGRAGVYMTLLETGMQSKDHPVLISMPETEYLKFALLRKGE